MSTRITTEDASWWWSGGMADIQYPAASQLPALSGFHYYQQGGSHYFDEQNQNVGSEMECLTLFQIKSHLQKYRIGKISRGLTTRDHVDENKSMDAESCHGSFDNNGDDTSEAPKQEILNHSVVPRTSVKNSAMMEHDDLHNFPEWSGLIDSCTDDSLNSFGYLSGTSTRDSSVYVTTFGNFFEDLDGLQSHELKLPCDRL